MNKRPLAKPYGQSDAVFLVSHGSIHNWYIFRFIFRSLSDISYSDECRTKKVLSVCEKNVSAFSCNIELLQCQQIIHVKRILSHWFENNFMKINKINIICWLVFENKNNELTVNISGSLIKEGEKRKYLGVTLNKKAEF